MSNRERILLRRAKLIAAAFASAAAAAQCGGTAQPCLKPSVDSGTVQDAGSDATNASDSSIDMDAGPQPCLAPNPD